MTSIRVDLNTAAEHYRSGRLDQARALFQQVLTADPRQADAWHFLGAMAYQAGRLDEARASLRHALDARPQFAEAHNTLGLIHFARGDLCAAAEHFSQATTHRPEYVEAYNHLGIVYQEQGKLDEAVQCLRRALELWPGDVASQHNLALALMLRGQLSEANSLVEALLAASPSAADAWCVQGLLQQRRGNAAAALDAFQQAESIAPHPNVASNALLTMQYLEDASPERLRAAHQAWNQRYAAAYRASASAGASSPARRHPDSLRRIGFLSRDFRQHAVVYLALPLIEQLNALGLEVIGYCDSHFEDGYTRRVRSQCAAWHVTRGWTDDALTRQIAADELDVLVDLMGHTGERMLVFARRPAPRQVTWAGYVGTTGLAEMDFLIADRFHVRPGEEAFYTEKVLRLPEGYVGYQPPDDAPAVSPLPAVANDYFTFGCFNNPIKFTPRLLAAWAEILRETPSSRLLLKYGGLDDPKSAANIRASFDQHGVAPTRIQIEGYSPHSELLAAYGRIDLALDTQPYSGGVTTCEALWMGVPVVTLPGHTFAGRHAVSHLNSSGFPQFVAADLAVYVSLAVEWASRRAELADLRRTMRDRVKTSPLCDAATFAQHFLQALRDVK